MTPSLPQPSQGTSQSCSLVTLTSPSRTSCRRRSQPKASLWSGRDHYRSAGREEAGETGRVMLPIPFSDPSISRLRKPPTDHTTNFTFPHTQTHPLMPSGCRIPAYQASQVTSRWCSAQAYGVSQMHDPGRWKVGPCGAL